MPPQQIIRYFKKYGENLKDRVEAISSDEMSKKSDSKMSTGRKKMFRKDFESTQGFSLVVSATIINRRMLVWMFIQMGFFEPPSCDLQVVYSNSELGHQCLMLNGCSKGSA